MRFCLREGEGDLTLPSPCTALHCPRCDEPNINAVQYSGCRSIAAIICSYTVPSNPELLGKGYPALT